MWVPHECLPPPSRELQHAYPHSMAQSVDQAAVRAMLKGTDMVVLHVLSALGVPATVVRVWEHVSENLAPAAAAAAAAAADASCFALGCTDMDCYAAPCLAMLFPCHVALCHAHASSSHATPRRAMPVPRHTMTCPLPCPSLRGRRS